MNDANLILKAYYEALHDRLEAGRDRLNIAVERLLTEEVQNRGYEDFDADKYAAYKDACLAFIEERIEAYNPIGVQYTFDRVNAKEVLELELQLNWYDSTAEFDALVQAALAKSDRLTGDNLRPLADELISEFGAFPDGSIIAAYHQSPTLNKLPDYIAATAIEDLVGPR